MDMYPAQSAAAALRRVRRAEIVERHRSAAAAVAQALAARKASKPKRRPQRSIAPQLVGEVTNRVLLSADVQAPEPITINVSLPPVTVNVTLDIPKSKGQTIKMPDGSVIETAPK